jgi:glycosyltransferase involved in cell wall biosynthesis
MAAARPRKILLVSSNRHLSPQVWGGSEELWTLVAPMLAAEGHKLAACFSVAPLENHSIRRLREAGIPVHFRLAVAPLAERLTRKIRAYLDPTARLDLTQRRALEFGPDLVIINQGSNADGIGWAAFCRKNGWKYLLINQQASDMDWPDDEDLEGHIAAHTQAIKSYHVSPDNLRITQEQIGQVLPNAEVISNPFVLDTANLPAWPAEDGTWRLAMVGRLHVNNKGLDMIFRVMRAEKWRDRPIEINLYGRGGNEQGLKRLKEFFGLKNIHFRGKTANINEVWSANHALLMCSRKEGQPLVLLEAMKAGRMPIVTPCSGCLELVEDGVNGFKAAYYSDAAIDEVLERAWTRRAEWRALGEAAAAGLHKQVPADPVASFKGKLDEVLAGL